MKEVEQVLVWQIFVGNGIPEEHIGFVIKSPKNGAGKLFSIKILPPILIELLRDPKYFASFSNTSNLFLILILNNDIVPKDFSVLVKKLLQTSGPLSDILNLLF